MENVARAGTFLVLLLISGSVLAAKPIKNPPVAAEPAPQVTSVKIDYANSSVLVEGTDLGGAAATATIAGVPLLAEGDSSDTSVGFLFTPDLSAAVSETGNYVVNISTAGGTFTLSAFIPFGLITPLPPGPDCPCSTEWDAASTNSLDIGNGPSDGFQDLSTYCSEDQPSWVTVQFYDEVESLYWVLWTEWSAGTGSGYCELFIDGPNRPLSSETEFDACAAYLRNVITVWGAGSNTCLF